MNDLAKLVLAAIISGLIGGGSLAALLFRGLRDRLREDLRDDYASRSDLNHVGSRLNAFENIVIQVRERADTNHDAILRIEERHEQQWERITERLADQVIKPLERLVERLDEMSRRQERHDAEIQNLKHGASK